MLKAALWLLLAASLARRCVPGLRVFLRRTPLRALRWRRAPLDSDPPEPRDRSLSLAGNQISKLNVDHLRLYSNLEFLDLSGNRISEIPSQVFAALPKLKVLRLGANNVTALERDAFVGLYQLQFVCPARWRRREEELLFCVEGFLLLFVYPKVGAISDSGVIWTSEATRSNASP
ncbi:hypothetical protein L596_009477 [Steinernema carpocapsae]|uniref:Uncharacterized protein n=1 Tax=Steinernema carpocapsae TaxID=34508 RepID=A0A4U5PFN3_STECR|nr:hypothetical protein L596_009477 [Steinernema carpocapsae]